MLEDVLLRLDVGKLSRLGYLRAGERRGFGWMRDGELLGAVEIAAATDAVDVIGVCGQASGLATTIELDQTRTPFGHRPWWRCPSCDRRCALLFLMPPRFRCRGCAELPHLSTVLGKRDRLLYRREVAARRCGVDPWTGRMTRPRYMHLDKWLGLVERYETADRAVVSAVRVRASRPPTGSL